MFTVPKTAQAENDTCLAGGLAKKNNSWQAMATCAVVSILRQRSRGVLRFFGRGGK